MWSREFAKLTAVVLAVVAALGCDKAADDWRRCQDLAGTGDKQAA